MDFNWIKIIILSAIAALAGCDYNSTLLHSGPIPKTLPLRICTNVPLGADVKLSETGVFILSATGPGLVSGGIAFLVDETNNYSHRKLLNSVLSYEDYSKYFRYQLKKSIGSKVYADSDAIKAAKDYDPSQEYYSLNVKLSYGIYKNFGQPRATLEGELIRVSDGALIWRNKLIYEYDCPKMDSPYSPGKAAAYYWNNHREELRQAIKKANRGLAQLLVRELTDDNMIKPLEPIQTLRIWPKEIYKAQIIERQEDRLILRAENGSLRSIPDQSLISRLRPVFSVL